MTDKVWVLEKELCRCCHAEGTFINLAEPHRHLLEDEIYSDIIRECLDIELRPVPGKLCEVTYAICPACVTRLRDVKDFKKQVLSCEDRFLSLYNKNAIKVVEPEIVIKEESSDGEDVKEDDYNMDGEDFHIKDDEDSTDSDFSLEPLEHFSKNTTVSKGKSRKKVAMKSETKAKSKAKATTVADLKEPKKQEERKRNAPIREEDQNVLITNDSEGAELFTCSTCQRVFKRRDCFRQHYRHVHMKLRPKLRGCYLCDVKVPGHMRALHLEEVHDIPAPTCGACGKKFSFPFQVSRHQKIYHMGEKNYSCPTCDMKFSTRSNLSQHVIKHSTVRTFKCEYCDEAFKWRKHLLRHVKAHMNKKRSQPNYYTVKSGQYTCNVCQKTYASQPLVSQHYRFVHLKKRPRVRKCPRCDTKIPGHLRAYHLEEVHGLPAPNCGICGKRFRYNCQLMEHQKKVHMGEKTVSCDVCEKMFFNKLSLRLHMSTHSSLRRFKCSICEREFKWENNLKDHMKIHTGDRRYGCKVCGKTFVQKSTMKQHIGRNHPDVVL